MLFLSTCQPNIFTENSRRTFAPAQKRLANGKAHTLEVGAEREKMGASRIVRMRSVPVTGGRTDYHPCSFKPNLDRVVKSRI
jgi:hypothetical protein